ncbi:MAG: sigma-70 family RNA polymerase sigma factor [Clostridia bacterium]|nr:sigma-70 family RNA polymerase sigma factor [Clostridia bacterium]
MNFDEDKILYQNFINGDMKSFENLIMKYKSNVLYFIFKYVKNIDISEDIFQDVVLYILSHKEVYKFEYSFKSFFYLIAKSRALNYLRNQKSVANIDFNGIVVAEEKLLEDIVFEKEKNKKIKQVLCKLDENYRLVIYFTILEKLSYEETAKIMDKSISQIKNLVHRARIKLRKLLIDERMIEMKENKVIKLFIMFIVIVLISSGIVYAVIKNNEKKQGKAKITPTFTSKLSEFDTNKVWVGTFNLAWNDLINDVIGGPIEFEDGYSELANELNKQTFKEKELSKDSYFKIHGESSFELKEKIENEIKNKFNETSKILDKVEWGNPNSYTLYCMLKKEFNFLEPFPTLENETFGNSSETVEYFGIIPSTPKEASVNIEVLFYNSSEEFAIKLKTKEKEEVILYRTKENDITFEECYQKLNENAEKYSGEKEFGKEDILKIPYINISEEINYDELCGRMIKGTDWYINQAIQTIDFELNNYGGSVKSEALVEILKSASEINRRFCFIDEFVLFLKEEDKHQPYFALKVDNTKVLVKD